MLIDIGGTFSYFFSGCAVLLLLTGLMGILTLRTDAGYLPWIGLILIAGGLNLAMLIALLFFKSDFIDAIADAQDVADKIDDNTTITCIFAGVGVAACGIAALVARTLHVQSLVAAHNRAHRASRTPASTV